MQEPSAVRATLRAHTCIEPDRIAHLARDVSHTIIKGLRVKFIQFDGAIPGQLLFSVRTRLPRTELMSFTVEITRTESGFTLINAHICSPAVNRPALSDAEETGQSPGYAVYKHYTQELAAALARFDPLSTAILVETNGL
ncbi:hypothetical protein [Mycobacterium sp. OTB74]|jgi:hypothetical protein|uniref:hypothetical protein n=1 Tax=Mycobacterium sp. OTB74 TaxID=1853452 RepID=UPI002475091C|nr:hypothetical protein [Mycobacterium sp. OTB74]MDH6243490.1 hypothetical protein [Mycobacterium sp. OTB74]